MSACRRRQALTVVPIIVLALLGSGCGGSDDGDAEDAADTTTNAEQATDHADEDGGSATDAGADGPGDASQQDAQQITITAPKAFETLVGTMVLQGRARVAEGALAWTIQSGQPRPLASGRMTATCGAPCRGTYRTPIPLGRVPAGSYELHVFAPNAGEGPARLHETMVPITIATERIPGAPPPDAAPPGGLPQG